MAKSVYKAEASVSGGRVGHGASSDGTLEVELRRPPEMGGEGGGTNPEQLFAVGYAACFASALGVVARRQHVELGDVSVESSVSLLTTEDKGYNVEVELHVSLPQIPDPDQATQLVADTHQVCAYSNATRGNVDVTLTANGRDVGAHLGS
ncbi:MAG: organic hydroperoxide resistance protein [Solirubrobacterales bacterium]|nr:organic hydroperoxide resistance protein [Solirubrobacterales bacterium]